MNNVEKAVVKAKVQLYLQEKDTKELVDMWNEFAVANHYDEDFIYSMYELNEVASSREESPLELLTWGRGIDTRHPYFVDGVHGAYSFSVWNEENSPIELSDLANFIIDQQFDFQEEELAKIINEYNWAMVDDEEAPKQKYIVSVTETLSRDVEVEASSKEEAEEMVKAMYEKEEIVLDYNDFTDEALIKAKEVQ